ncbi:hypothetical protein PSECIP111951_01719 [Pseudoalteromonas holothuriae]|uniref:HNH domain-containing protein n=1 Tax=Pseudoalteromonas holothuriae TaxID=2963714 RepID=A0ABN8UM45_9GAMM|nr:hypothetical protein [Pseudoalteromonas sp. CIP111951]CAH9057688.1 hypothetical protein PSECIP111951_01719 [Pseudoalteromonas sp. CIP111951]
MEFVERSEIPKVLSLKQAEWTLPWVQHYEKHIGEDSKLIRKNKPTTSHWLNHSIREPLMSDFKHNCGYCGRLIAKPWSQGEEIVNGKGDVDHFRAKSEYPHLVYKWSNFIWSCKPCNQLKGNFDDPVAPIFNPCRKDDCIKLEFTSDFGSYQLVDEYRRERLFQEQFTNTQLYTLINSDDICTQRKNIITLLRGYFQSIRNLLEAIRAIEGTPLHETVREALNQEILTNLERIKISKKSQDFKLLVTNSLAQLIIEYKEVSDLLGTLD